jgi:hypothetical protein
MRVALIDKISHMVVWVIMVDSMDEAALQAADTLDLIESATAQVGALWNGTNFTNPSPITI